MREVHLVHGAGGRTSFLAPATIRIRDDLNFAASRRDRRKELGRPSFPRESFFQRISLSHRSRAKGGRTKDRAHWRFPGRFKSEDGTRRGERAEWTFQLNARIFPQEYSARRNGGIKWMSLAAREFREGRIKVEGCPTCIVFVQLEQYDNTLAHQERTRGREIADIDVKNETVVLITIFPVMILGINAWYYELHIAGRLATFVRRRDYLSKDRLRYAMIFVEHWIF